MTSLEEIQKRTETSHQQFVRRDFSENVPQPTVGMSKFGVYFLIFICVLACSLWMLISSSLRLSPFNDDRKSHIILGISIFLLLSDFVWLLFSIRYVLFGGLPCNMPSIPPKELTFIPSTPRSIPLTSVAIIVNPQSGVSSKKIAMSKLQTSLLSKNIKCTVLETAYAAHNYDYGFMMDFSPFSAIIIMGGDGSLMEFVSGMNARTDNQRIPVGILPCGTGNSVCADLGSWDLDIAINRILEGVVMPMDGIRVRDDKDLDLVSVNVLSLGLICDIAAWSESTRWLGNLRYDVCGLWGLLRLGKTITRIDYTDENSTNASITAPMVTSFFNNTQYFGRGHRVNPGATLNDGLCELTYVEDASRGQLLEIFAQLPVGAHINGKHSVIQRIKLTKATVYLGVKNDEDSSSNFDGKNLVNIDGEMFLAHGLIHIEIIPNAFEILASPETVSK